MVILHIPWNRFRWSCCTPCSCSQTHPRSTWCSRDGRHAARTAARWASHRTASSKSGCCASPCSWLWCIRRWKLTAQNKTKQKSISLNHSQSESKDCDGPLSSRIHCRRLLLTVLLLLLFSIKFRTASGKDNHNRERGGDARQENGGGTNIK